MIVPVADRMRADLIKQARTMRKRKCSHKLIARRLGIGVATVWEWTSDIKPPYTGPKSKVAYDAEDGCWRIYIYQKVGEGPTNVPDPQHGVNWWPLKWAGWATEELAQAYLDKHGDYAVAS